MPQGATPIAVETKCPHCGYLDWYAMFSWATCRTCRRDYYGVPRDKQYAMKLVLGLLEKVKALPD